MTALSPRDEFPGTQLWICLIWLQRILANWKKGG